MKCNNRFYCPSRFYRPACAKAVYILLFIFSSEFTHACNFKAKTELEKVYCEIKSRGEGKSLPSIFEFRKNSAQTQALLLKKPAAKLGISLPNNKPSQSSTSQTARSSQTKINTATATNTTPQKTDDKTRSSTGQATVQRQTAISAGLSHCRLQKATITCNTERYTLVTNLHNRQLDSNALTAENVLVLPEKNSPAFKNTSTQNYLSQVYTLYIEKMLKIGLADATMSFTKFVATYHDIENQGESFTNRFNKMYELLKAEKQTIAVKARYNNNFPTSVNNCMALSADLLACDNVKQNWIYKK